MVTMRDVAEEAGVSKATVSHVINKTRYVSPELTQRVKETMKELGYKPNAVARSLTTRKTHTIGLIVSDISNPFFSTLVRGVEDAAVENDHSLIVCNTDETLEKEKLYIDVLIQKKMDGLIIAPTGKSDENLKLLVEDDIPFVFVDRKIQGIESDAVLSQNVEGAYKATKYLIEQGHKKIGIILGLESVNTTKERFKGYKKALGEFNLDFDDRLAVRANSRVSGGIAATETLLSLNPRPTAIFGTNNLMTIGAMQGIKRHGLGCPKDVSLVGFDDFEWAAAFEPTLTTVLQHPYQIGSMATSKLLDRLKKGDNQNEFSEVRLPTDLIIRNSVRSLK